LSVCQADWPQRSIEAPCQGPSRPLYMKTETRIAHQECRFKSRVRNLPHRAIIWISTHLAKRPFVMYVDINLLACTMALGEIMKRKRVSASIVKTRTPHLLIVSQQTRNA